MVQTAVTDSEPPGQPRHARQRASLFGYGLFANPGQSTVQFITINELIALY